MEVPLSNHCRIPDSFVMYTVGDNINMDPVMKSCPGQHESDIT